MAAKKAKRGGVNVMVQQKGGATKTSTTSSLAGISAEKGRRTLFIDADQNAKGTQRFGLYPPAKEGIGAAVSLWKPLKEYIVKHPSVPNLWILPMTEGFKDDTLRRAILNRIEAETPEGEEVDHSPGNVTRKAIGYMQELLEPLRADFEHLFVDTHNDRNFLSTMFWGNADVALGATQPTVDDVGSLMSSIKFLELARQDGNRDLQYLGFVINRYPFGAMGKNADRILKQVHPHLARFAFQIRLPEKPAVAEESEELKVPHPLTPLAREGGSDGFHGRAARLFEELETRATSGFWAANQPHYAAYVAWAEANNWRNLTEHVRNLVGGGRSLLKTEKTKAIEAKIAASSAKKAQAKVVEPALTQKTSKETRPATERKMVN
jgi:cellulose biosynthesis protein BcsQ